MYFIVHEPEWLICNVTRYRLNDLNFTPGFMSRLAMDPIQCPKSATGDILPKFHKLLYVGSEVIVGMFDMHMNMIYKCHFAINERIKFCSGNIEENIHIF
jgi:hypothetical protein